MISVNHNPDMILLHPYWLILLIPAAALLLRGKISSRVLIMLRVCILLLLVLALCRPALKLGSRSGTVVILADRSRSMPEESRSAMKELISLVRSGMEKDDRLAVVSFAQQSAVERYPLPKNAGEFEGFVTEVGEEQSDMAPGLETALSLIPRESPGRILLLSDGKYTRSDPRNAAIQAAGRGIATDFRYFPRSAAGDTAISDFKAPETLTPGQSFVLRAEIQSPAEQELAYRLFRGNTAIVSGRKKFSAGKSFLLFRDRAETAGTNAYRLEISGVSGNGLMDDPADDPVPENNRAGLLVGIKGPRALLHVSLTPDSGLAAMLGKSRLDVRSMQAEKLSWSLEELSAYTALILENLPADAMSYPGMENIAAWLRHSGSGLMVTGGMNAYGPGGYFRSPLEDVLPVSMELRNEHRKMNLAIVIVLDRSGSMAMKAEGGQTKMDLANIGAVQVLDLLSPFDEFGVIAVDSVPHSIVSLKPAEQADAERGKILSIDSGGGGIFVYAGLSAAAEMLLKAKAETRHIILFADAADAEEPGEYQELIQKCVKANISVSVIGLGTPQDSDAALLEDIAIIGGGQSFFTIHPREIPRLFAQDTFSVARSAFIKEKTGLSPTAALSGLTDISFSAFPEIGGYNLCYTRPEAAQALTGRDEYQSPMLAYWHRGKGRAVSYMGEADGEFTGPLAQWEQAGDFFSSLARWAAGEQGTLPEDMLLTQENDKGILRIQLHLDPERKNEAFAESPKVGILRGIPGKKPKQESRTMIWTSADTLSLEIPLDSSETVLPTVYIPGFPAQNLSPVCLPYSPEYLPSQNPDEGRELLQELARISGGKERIRVAEIWKDLPEKQQYLEIGQWLLLAGLLVFLLEILQRRSGILHFRMPERMVFRKKTKRKTAESRAKKEKKSVKTAETGRENLPGDQTVKEEPSSEPKKETKEDAFLAMQKAKKRAEERMKR